MLAGIQVINELCTDHGEGERNLCFHWRQYAYDDGANEQGCRFIRRRPDGSLQPARGQARTPSVAVLVGLAATAKRESRGDLAAE